MLLHRIEVSLLALTGHPLETVPEDISILVFFLFDRGSVWVLLLEVGMRGHAIERTVVATTPTTAVVIPGMTTSFLSAVLARAPMMMSLLILTVRGITA